MTKVILEFDTQDKMSVLDAYMIAGEMMHKAFPKWFMKGGESMDNEQMKNALHEARKEVDANIQKVAQLKTTSINQLAGRELALAYTKLQEAKMWLGKCLEMIGSELPKEFQDKA